MTRASILGAIGALLIAGVAQAGMHADDEVQITGDSKLGQAQGGVSGARESADDEQYIGCRLESGGTDPDEAIGVCQARDAKGFNIQCRARTVAQRKIIASIGSTSFITFTVNSGVCGYLSVENASLHSPTP